MHMHKHKQQTEQPYPLLSMTKMHGGVPRKKDITEYNARKRMLLAEQCNANTYFTVANAPVTCRAEPAMATKSAKRMWLERRCKHKSVQHHVAVLRHPRTVDFITTQHSFFCSDFDFG